MAAQHCEYTKNHLNCTLSKGAFDANYISIKYKKAIKETRFGEKNSVSINQKLKEWVRKGWKAWEHGNGVAVMRTSWLFSDGTFLSLSGSGRAMVMFYIHTCSQGVEGNPKWKSEQGQTN